MTSCAYPGCPMTGNHEHNGKDYCLVHVRLVARVDGEHKGPLGLPKLDRVNVEGRDN